MHTSPAPITPEAGPKKTKAWGDDMDKIEWTYQTNHTMLRSELAITIEHETQNQTIGIRFEKRRCHGALRT